MAKFSFLRITNELFFQIHAPLSVMMDANTVALSHAQQATSAAPSPKALAFLPKKNIWGAPMDDLTPHRQYQSGQALDCSGHLFRILLFYF